MRSILEAVEHYASHGWLKEWLSPDWNNFLVSGDEKYLKNLPRFGPHSRLPDDLLSALPFPERIDLSAKRFLQACYAARHPKALGSWIHRCSMADNPAGDRFARACAIVLEIGCPLDYLATQVAELVRPLLTKEGTPSPAGRFLLSLDDKMFMLVFRCLGTDANHAPELTQLFATQDPQRWKAILEKFNQAGESKTFDPSAWILALNFNPAVFVEPAARAFELIENWYHRFELGTKLQEIQPERFGPALEALATRQLLAKDTLAQIPLWKQAHQSATWLIAHRAEAALPLLQKYFSGALKSDPFHEEVQSEYKNEILELAVQKLGRRSTPLLKACFETNQPEVQLRALQLWTKLNTEAEAEQITERLRKLFGAEDATTVARAVRIASDLFPALLQADLKNLLSHKSRPVRDAAAKTLASLGDSHLPRVEELWASKRTVTRTAVVAWLQALGSPKASRLLESRLDEEEEEDVRDAILLALEKMDGAKTEMDAFQIRDRIKKTLAKKGGTPASWLDLKKLPLPRMKDGSTLPLDALSYLLYRQSRVKEMRADIEAKPLYQQLNRDTTGDLAVAILQGYFASKAEADDRWAMALAAVIGDNRLVPLFTRQIKDWADHMRGKLAEYAVQALALLGTDAALLAVDTMAIRYRSKNKNIGKAASEAFAEAAQTRGVTVEELGDLVVPWLGFESTKPRIVDAGKLKIEARISPEFKLLLRDPATGKKLAKLPDSAPVALKNEFKELTAGLKEAVKSQLLRMETLMVRQFRWTRSRWQELYLTHPLLLPFAQRLVWGVYNKEQLLVATFRTLEDHSLTNVQDEPYTAPEQSEIGIVHPLELTLEARQAWLKHLADYNVVPPFSQLERPVVTPKPDQQSTVFGKEVTETELNAMTFKGRAERLGWMRGSVCDAGSIGHYLKSFPTAGVDVFVELDGMYVGIDMESTIKLGKIFFVNHGSVQIGSYVYDEPEDHEDPRLLVFGAVPAIAFSEAMGDLVKISGKQAGEKPLEEPI